MVEVVPGNIVVVVILVMDVLLGWTLRVRVVMMSGQ